MSQVSTTTVSHIAKLAAIPITSTEAETLASAFSNTLKVVDHLQSVDVSSVEPTHQVTGLENIWREDVVDSNRQFSQQQALANAPQTHQGYVVVPRVLATAE